QNAANPETAMKQASPAIAKKLQELAGAAGANPQQVAACSAEPATAARVRKSLELGEALEVTGTPTLYINGRRLQNLNGIPYEVLKSMVDTAKSGK
ncbi:MAG TPA: DsbA family protein, partial [Terriglobales bacterium]|nr:DsbA family protein [Terriglobales bacterium]